MLGLFRFCIMSLAISIANPAFSAAIENLRLWKAPDSTRLVFDLDSEVKHSLFALDNPDRIVIDIPNSSATKDFSKVDLSGSPIKRIRTGLQSDKLRVVLDLSQRVEPSSFSLVPNDQYGHRLVVDLGWSGGAKIESETAPSTPVALPTGNREIVIAVDAGHGGDDPGALGPYRLREKDVVLAIAKEVKRQIDAEPGFRAELVRSGDYYVSLRGRTRKARKLNADLFVSIHADAAQSSKARGASVWVLSNRGASSEMGRWLASKENSADLIGGVGSVSLEDKDETLASVLLDMSMTYARTSSSEVAGAVHENIARFAKMHKNYVEKAGFVVLKSPDIPSILVETGFISNPSEAKRLKDSAYQKRMARAIADGIVGHFWSKPPAATLVATLKQQGKQPATIERSHKVAPGDSLSIIAERNGVSLDSLRRFNQLKSDRIRVGQVLKIPAG